MGTSDETKPHVVILVHGIRDFALWHQEIRETLENHGFIVEPTNYGRFNLLKFLAPIQFFRREALADVENQIRIVRKNNKDADISIIAHSFGTYVVAHLLQKGFDTNLHRIIFCGSVLSFRFPFEQFQERFVPPILNDVGTKDVWPAVAYSVTFGYGYSGSYGFRRPLVRDRWHRDAHHGYFLNSEFCEKYWVPFLRDGEIVTADRDLIPQGFWVQLLIIFQIRYVLLLLIVIGWLVWSHGGPDPRPDPIPDVVPDANAGLFCSKENVRNPFPTFFDYVNISLSDCTPTSEGASRAFLVRYEANGPRQSQQRTMTGYTHCFDSDFYEKAPIVAKAMDIVFDELKDRVSCKMTSSVTRVINIGYITKNNDSKTAAFAQTYNLGNSQRLQIDQVPFTSVVQSQDLIAVSLDANNRFSTHDILEHIRLFGLPGVIKE